ncbi:uncharacterized protein LOC135218578 isoform X1 [Macrobrachium nipponense]|uniref:uncharacterized protein LOC135218578 isoform X1 n=1 Tax=Macrobrachium nipponense TaxID=159736 RepID=UPI0030C7CE30
MAEAFVKMFDAAPSSLVADSPRTRASPTHYVYIELEDEVISQLRVLQEALSEEAMKFDLEEIDILHAHITLGVFDLRPCMQEYSEESLDCLKRELLLEVMEDRPSFQANFLSLGHFSGKFLYVEIERSQDLLDLRSKVLAESPGLFFCCFYQIISKMIDYNVPTSHLSINSENLQETSVTHHISPNKQRQKRVEMLYCCSLNNNVNSTNRNNCNNSSRHHCLTPALLEETCLPSKTTMNTALRSVKPTYILY